MADEQELKSCQACGATIYPEHLDAGKAGFWQGQLLCPVCLNEKKSETASTQAIDEDEPITLVDATELEQTHRTIESFAKKRGTEFDESKLKRPLNKTGTGATRFRIFHSKISDGAMDFMTKQINEWLDSNEEIEVKMVQSHVGILEGKHPEPHLILTVWY